MTGTTGADDYQFDANGRLTLIQRDGVTIDLNHDAGDRLTSVENATTGKTTEYVYDGQGNRVGAIEGSEVRQFLVAPGMGSGLNSTDLIADGNGNLISNYVYAGGASPFMMLDANGNPVYYLSDGMGSVIGLANGSGNEVGDFRYDSFGNVREEWGGAIGSAGGDFRFQGQWLESDTGIYHFRARDYDAQTGTFLSRDPIDPNEQQPEAMNPYQFAYNNPYVYSDPSGMITLIELNANLNGQSILQNFQRAAVSEAKDYIKERLGDIVGDVLGSFLQSFLPGSSFLDVIQSVNRRDAGREFEYFARGELCDAVKGTILENLWITSGVTVAGTPVFDGWGCSQRRRADNPSDLSRLGINPSAKRPDFIFREKPPTVDYRDKDGFLIGDFKLSTKTLVESYRSGNGSQREQWYAITNYARKWQYVPVTLFLTVYSGYSSAQLRQERVRTLQREAVSRGVIMNVLSLH